MKQQIYEQIRTLFEEVAEGSPYFLVDVDIEGGKEQVIWVFVDAEDQDVTLDQCADLSRELGFLIDAHDAVSGNYRLNVSTPGLSRPLSDPRQYKKNVGRKVRIKYKYEGDYKKAEGILKEYSGDTVTVLLENDQETEILFKDIVKTKVIPVI